MPYRVRDASGPYCYRHEADEAAARCARCATPVCLICTNETVRGALCDRCHERNRWRARLRSSALLVAVLLVVCGMSLGLGTAFMQRDPNVNAMHLAERILQSDPCDGSAMYVLGNSLTALHREGEAVIRSEEFLRQCGFDEAVARLRFDLLSPDGGEAALAAIRYLVDHVPDDNGYQYALGMQLARSERPLEAAAVFERIRRRWPWDRQAAVALAQIDEARGFPCDAADVLASVQQYQDDTALLEQVRELRRRGDCRVARETGCGCPTCLWWSRDSSCRRGKR